MEVSIAQIRLKTADFAFNFQNVISKIETCKSDVMVFPQADVSELGGKDLCNDEKCNIEQVEFYNKIAEKKYNKAIFIGDVLIKNGEIVQTEDGFYDVDGKTVYVSSNFRDDIECDLYILSKNRYYAINSVKDFVESIDVTNDFIYVNAVAMADANVFAGGSFAKNKNNELVAQLSFCEEKLEKVNFTGKIKYNELPIEEQIYKITTFALKEYCENTGFKKVVLGLSGGIDSAISATLATRALGAENVLGILMPSMFSSAGSVDDALKLAQNIGIKTEKHSITPLFDNFMEKIAHETLDTSGKENLAVENLQARLRAIILMYFSNRDNRLLISTGNKSESAMGYGTLYGDLTGGFNMICDLTKTNVYKLASFINKDNEVIPKEIIEKAPSAELRPGQKDQDSLPEYAVLDDIIEMYLEQGKSQDEIYEKYDKKLVDDTIKRIYRAEYKRHQCCLGVRLTERSFCGGICLPVVQKMY